MQLVELEGLQPDNAIGWQFRAAALLRGVPASSPLILVEMQAIRFSPDFDAARAAARRLLDRAIRELEQ